MREIDKERYIHKHVYTYQDIYIYIRGTTRDKAQMGSQRGHHHNRDWMNDEGGFEHDRRREKIDKAQGDIITRSRFLLCWWTLTTIVAR